MDTNSEVEWPIRSKKKKIQEQNISTTNTLKVLAM